MMMIDDDDDKYYKFSNGIIRDWLCSWPAKATTFYKNILTAVLGRTQILFLILMHKYATEGQHRQINDLWSQFHFEGLNPAGFKS